MAKVLTTSETDANIKKASVKREGEQQSLTYEGRKRAVEETLKTWFEEDRMTRQEAGVGC